MPVQRRCQALGLVVEIDDDDVVLAHLNLWPRQHQVDRQKTATYPIRDYAVFALAMFYVAVGALIA